MIKHMTTGEEEDEYQADCCPKIAVLNDRGDYGPCHREERDSSKKTRYNGNPEAPVDWACDWWVRSAIEVTREPSVSLLCSLRASQMSTVAT